ncbi:MAG: 5,10-methylenetetrahydrofolate reductase [Rhodobacterales bacterium]|nr:MAG: 5,10-methylenetetrahydrofolate reductase [Rhodobacterales bacterium]
MALLNFRKRDAETAPVNSQLEAFLHGYSIEVMPRTAAKVEDFTAILPKGTRVYIAHIEGTPIEDMVATARRIRGEGYDVMPHFPARIIKDRATLENWIAMYQGEADVKQALLLAGGVATPQGDFDNSMQLLDTGLFDAGGFTNLHVAGHPEPNLDIDPKGGRTNTFAALDWKQEFSKRTDAQMALATQFCFEAEPVIDWCNSLTERGINIPVHIGIAGPAKLQTMIKFAIACGVGPSLKVLQKRAKDVSKLLVPHEPTKVLSDLATHKAANPDFNIEKVHFFPLGGIKTNANWAKEHGGASGVPAAAS